MKPKQNYLKLEKKTAIQIENIVLKKDNNKSWYETAHIKSHVASGRGSAESPSLNTGNFFFVNLPHLLFQDKRIIFGCLAH